jgi:tRNA-Thr(GGU) m(6)t(6)A37 methyltransferase TsaA
VAGLGDLPGLRRTLTLEPIGVARTPFLELAEAPRQAAVARGVPGRIELTPGVGFEDALIDVETWSHLWVIFWFDRAGPSSVRKVRPPRSKEKRGVFATRSPHRPNPIGLSLVRLLRVEGLTLHIEDLDLVDGTPILDLKPYVPYADTAPDANSGWLGRAADPAPAWRVVLSPIAEEQLAWLEAEGETALRDRLSAALALGPAPHPYRRIRENPDGGRTIALKAWRADFTLDGTCAEVLRVRSGHKDRDLAAPDRPDLALHRAFTDRFGR